eukprot:GFUD01013475.1.p1 GENE.GFUD01013475.1~~GFUD01013475.1.p1  ORF type:complete len:798 (+),score=240.38 GFUD01013475.1:63-2456(+)
MEIPLLLVSTLLLVTHPCDGGQFWHMSDLHLDYDYTSGGNMSNWCHTAASTASPSINSDKVGPAGNYHCDSPADLVESALLAMVRFAPKPDFIVWTGDSAPHWRDPSPSEDYILNVTKHVFTRLDKLFPNIPIVPALGNHDASPPDQFPQYDPSNKTTPDYYLRLWQNGAFGDHIDPEAMGTFQKCGFYLKVLKPTNSSKMLKFIVLNTNLYYHDNSSTGTDPCGQLDWLNTTLHTADPEKEKVFIVAHVSPGSYERATGLSNFNTPTNDTATAIHKRYVQIVSDPTNAVKISAHLYGHLHTDTFRVLLDRATRREAVGVAFMAGSVTPVVWGKTGVVGVNPTIRLMEFNDDSATVMDYKEYSLDIIKAAKNDIKTDEDDTTETSEAPKSRRKNDKFLEASKEAIGDTNAGKSKRAAPEENPPAVSADNTTSTVVPIQPTARVTTAAPDSSPGQFTTIIAVPVTPSVPEAEVAVLGGNVVENSTSSSNSSLDENVTNPETTAEENTTAINNISDNVEKSNTSEITTVAMVNTQKEDYPTYLSKQWTLLYTATSSFSVPDLSPTSMFSTLKRMVSDGPESEVFVSYYKHNTGGHIVEECNETCWREQLCTISNLVIEELHTCLDSSGKEGFFEVSKSAIIAPAQGNSSNAVTTERTGSVFGEGNDDPDFKVHGDIDNNHDHDGDGEQDHEHEDHEDSDLDHDHDGDGEDDHNHLDHADHVPVVPEDEEVVTKEKLEESSSNISARAVAIFFGVFAVAIIALIALMGYKKYRDNRYRNQEFLLTDAVFRYDGYSQLDDA